MSRRKAAQVGWHGARRRGDRRYAAIGIDVEVARPLDPSVRGIVLGSEEEAWLRVSDDSGVVATAVFSAKESVYKAFFPLERRWLGFDDVVIVPSDAIGVFRARFLNEGPTVGGARIEELDVTWAVEGAVVATAVTVPAAAG